MTVGATLERVTNLLGVAGSITTLISLAALSLLIAYLLAGQWLRGKSNAAERAIASSDDNALARLLGGTAVPLDTLSPEQKFTLATDELRTRKHQRILTHSLLFFAFLALLGFAFALAIFSPATPAGTPPQAEVARKVDPMHVLGVLSRYPAAERAEVCRRLLSDTECENAAPVIQSLPYGEPSAQPERQEQAQALRQAIATAAAEDPLQMQDLAACAGRFEFRVQNERLVCADGTPIPNVAAQEARRPLAQREAIVFHATETPENSFRGVTRLIANGRADLRGPLAHILISRSGAVVQTASFGETAFHVGVSQPWQGMRVLNSNSIGIEMINQPSRRQPYTAAQIAAAQGIARALAQAYGIRVIVGHSEVASPNRPKTDPGPRFPISEVREVAALPAA